MCLVFYFFFIVIAAGRGRRVYIYGISRFMTIYYLRG